MTTERLIAQLARQAGPVRVLAPLGTRWAQWATIAAASAALGLWAFGIRADAASRLATGDFLLRAAITVAIAALAARHALRWTVPGAEPEGGGRWWPALLLVLWAGTLVVPLADASFGARLAAVRWHASCAGMIAAVSLVPGLWLFGQARRAAPYDVSWASGHAALAAAGAGALAVQGICGLDDRVHHLVWHLAPVAAATLALALAGGLVVRRH